MNMCSTITAAPALPVEAQAFLNEGGRLLLNERGKIEVCGLLFVQRGVSDEDAPRLYEIESRLCRAIKGTGYRRAVRRVLRSSGVRQGPFLVLRGSRS